MPRVYNLTYDKSRKWWVKRVAGRKVYLLKAESKSDRAAYTEAWRLYQERLPSLLATASSPPASSAGEHSVHRRTTRSRNAQLRHAVKVYLSELKYRVTLAREEGGITAGRASSVEGWLRPLILHLGEEFPIAKITESDILDYAQAQRLHQKNNQCAVNTLRQRFAIAKNFLRWCWKNRMLEDLPRNLDALRVGIPTPDKTPFRWKKEDGYEIQRVIAECKSKDSMLYLCVLLALNCGFTIKDISDLRASEFQWHTVKWKSIKRHRSKTKGFGEWVLWCETERMLKEKMKVSEADYKSDKRLLTNEDGSPLLPDNERGRCRIAESFKRVVRKLFGAKDRRSFRTLRKTGASFCFSRWQGSEVLYLAHQPSTMASKFYVEMSNDKLVRVLGWMEHQFGLSPVLVKRYAETPKPPKETSPD